MRLLIRYDMFCVCVRVSAHATHSLSDIYFLCVSIFEGVFFCVRGQLGGAIHKMCVSVCVDLKPDGALPQRTTLALGE